MDCSKNNALFGGIPVVLGGDFAQIPPVIKKDDRSTIVDASVKQSDIWEEIEVIHLRINMRINGTSPNDIHHKECLNQMTYNPTLQNTNIAIPSYIGQMRSLDQLISKVYPLQDLQRAINVPDLFFKSAILTTRNDNVELINTKVLDLVLGVPVTLLSADTVDTSDEVFQVSNEHLQTPNSSSLPPSKLTLKVGCIVILLRNLNPQRGLSNGTKLVVKEIGEYVLKVAVMNGNGVDNEQIEFIVRIKLTTTENGYPFVLTRKQFPVRLSFAMTINKSQGQSLTNVGIDFRYPVFTHGQLYVAFSRSTKLEGIHALIDKTK
jgi:hypothetical protein